MYTHVVPPIRSIFRCRQMAIEEDEEAEEAADEAKKLGLDKGVCTNSRALSVSKRNKGGICFRKIAWGLSSRHGKCNGSRPKTRFLTTLLQNTARSPRKRTRAWVRANLKSPAAALGMEDRSPLARSNDKERAKIDVSWARPFCDSKLRPHVVVL